MAGKRNDRNERGMIVKHGTRDAYDEVGNPDKRREMTTLEREQRKLVRFSRQRQWHRRVLMNISGSLVITLPARLIRFDREQSLSPTKWTPGDEVLIARTAEGDFVVRWSGENRERGVVEVDTSRVDALPVESKRSKRKSKGVK